MYISILDELSQKDKGFNHLLAKIKSGLANAVRDIKKEKDIQTKKTDDDKSEISQIRSKNEGYEKVMKEMKK